MTTYRRVGSSGLRVFPIGLGTMNFGWSADEPRSFEIMDAYAATGGNIIDTADIYSSRAGNSDASGVSQ